MFGISVTSVWKQKKRKIEANNANDWRRVSLRDFCWNFCDKCLGSKKKKQKSLLFNANDWRRVSFEIVSSCSWEGAGACIHSSVIVDAQSMMAASDASPPHSPNWITSALRAFTLTPCSGQTERERFMFDATMQSHRRVREGDPATACCSGRWILYWQPITLYRRHLRLSRDLKGYIEPWRDI